MAVTDAHGAHLLGPARATRHEVSPTELKRLLDGDDPPLLVDVREPDEFEGWHIPGAVNVPLDRLLSDARVRPAPDQQVVLVCSHGNRSELARAALAERGLRARGLAGGMVAWNSVYDVVPVDRALVPRGVEVIQFRRVGKGCLSYMVLSDGDALVIDPALDIDAYIEEAKARNARIRAVLDTHAHADHASGARLLANRVGATYHAPEEVGGHERTVRGGDRIRVGVAELVALAAPGHTPGSLAYRLGFLLFTGDTLFVEGVGRPDLGQEPGPNARVLWRTLRTIVGSLEPETHVLPGHVSPTTALAPDMALTEQLSVLAERLHALELGPDAFVRWVFDHQTAPPENFELLKAYNKGQAAIWDPEELRELEAGPNRCAVG